MLDALLVLGALLMAPPPEPGSQDPERTREPASPRASPGPATHGQLRVQLFELGTRDVIAGAQLLERSPDDPSADRSPPEFDPQPELDPLEQSEQQVETDAKGRASVWLSPGRHRFVVRTQGYDPLEFEVEVTRGEAQKLELRASRAFGEPRFRTVVASERAVALGKTTLRDDEITTLPGSGGDPFGVVKSLPGAAQVSGFLPYVVVRGAAPGNTGYYLDGVRVPTLFHLALGPSVIHPFFIDEIDFYPGGVPVRLGRYASGVVEGKTKQGARDRVRGELDLRLTDVGGLVAIPFDRPKDRACLAKADANPADCRQDARGSLSLGGRYSYAGPILAPFEIKLRYWDYQARLDHRLGPRARYTAFVFGSYDELGPTRTEELDAGGDVVSDEDPDPWLRLEFHRIDQRIRQRLRRGGRIDYRLALGLDRAGVSAARINQWRVAPRVDAQVSLGDHTHLHAGLDQEFQLYRLPQGYDPDLTSSVEDQALFLSERFVSVTGVYVDLAYRRGGFELRPGLRADLWVSTGPSPYLPTARAVAVAAALDPRVLARERVGVHLHLRQSLGVYHQPPDPPIPIPGVENIGLEDGLQRNVQATLGWEWALGDLATLTQDLFVGRLSNMQDYELSEGLDSSSDPSTADEIEDYLIRVSGWSFGVESMLRLVTGPKIYGWLAYTLAWSLRDYPLGGWAPATWDQRHVLNAVLGWNISPKWRLGGRLHFNSGRPYTARRSDDQGELEDLVVALSEHRNDARLPVFVQLDVRFERIFTLKRSRLHLYLDLANANFAREILRCDSLADTSDPATQVVDGCVNPQALRYVLPALGLRAVF